MPAPALAANSADPFGNLVSHEGSHTCGDDDHLDIFDELSCHGGSI